MFEQHSFPFVETDVAGITTYRCPVCQEERTSTQPARGFLVEPVFFGGLHGSLVATMEQVASYAIESAAQDLGYADGRAWHTAMTDALDELVSE